MKIARSRLGAALLQPSSRLRTLWLPLVIFLALNAGEFLLLGNRIALACDRARQIDASSEQGRLLLSGDRDSLTQLSLGFFVANIVAILIMGAVIVAPALDHLDKTQQNLAQKMDQLARQKEFTDSVLASMTDGVLAVSEAGNILSANRAACELFGREEESLVGQPTKTLLAQEDLFEALLGQLRREGSLDVPEVEILNKNGEPIPVTCRCALLRGRKDELLGHVSVVRDKRPLIECEKHRKEAEVGRRLEKIRQATEILSGDLSRAELMQHLVDALRGLLGCEFALLLDWSEGAENPPWFFSAKEEWARPATLCPPRGDGLLQALMDSTHPIYLERTSEHPKAKGLPEGHPVLGALLACPVRLQGRLLAGLYASATPGGFSQADHESIAIFARSAAVAIENTRLLNEIETGRSTFLSIVERSTAGILVAGSEGTLHFVNRAGRELLGKSLDELEGAGFGKVILSADSRELDILRGDGEPGIGEMRVSQTDWSGRPARLAMIRDVTEQRALEEKLRHAQKLEAVGQLAGGVAHDFNNILTTIGAYARMAAEGLDRGDPRRADLDAIAAAVQKAASLIRGLLAFSRKQIRKPRGLDLGELVQSMEKVLRRLVGEGIQLEIRQANTPCRVLADQGQIEQIILNLVSNARDAMPNGGHLLLETGELSPTPDVLLRVSDTGSGMDGATRSRIFEPFFTTKAVGKGTGLGLASVYGIVKQSGGRIEVESEPEKGTTFRILFPRLIEDSSTQDAAAPADFADQENGSETILLVEDDPSVRAILVRILEGGGYRVLLARDGHEALECSERLRAPLPLLLTDIIMPGISGRELADRLASQRPETKVLFMSGHSDESPLPHRLSENRVGFLQKPFEPAEILRAVREALRS